MVPVVVVLLLLAELPLVVTLPRKRKRRRRKRVCQGYNGCIGQMLIPFTEKEESDEDMGFGLFD